MKYVDVCHIMNTTNGCSEEIHLPITEMLRYFIYQFLIPVLARLSKFWYIHRSLLLAHPNSAFPYSLPSFYLQLSLDISYHLFMFAGMTFPVERLGTFKWSWAIKRLIRREFPGCVYLRFGRQKLFYSPILEQSEDGRSDVERTQHFEEKSSLSRSTNSSTPTVTKNTQSAPETRSFSMSVTYLTSDQPGRALRSRKRISLSWSCFLTWIKREN